MSAFSGDSPRSWKKSDMSGAMSTQGLPSAAPSNVTEPIITASSGTVPGSGFSAARPESGRAQADVARRAAPTPRCARTG